MLRREPCHHVGVTACTERHNNGHRSRRPPAAAIERDNRAIAASPEKTTSSLSARAYQFPLPPAEAERGREPSELQEPSRTSDHFARSANPGPYTNKIMVISSSGSCRSFAYTWEELS